MKAKNLSLCIIACLVFTGIGPAMAVYADDLPGETSEANVEFTAGTDPTDPVDPENPGQPGEGGGTGAAGPLSIDYVSKLSFSGEITGGNATYNTTVSQPYIQVTDKRGSGTGWKVTASLGQFYDADDNTLPGVTLTLTGGRLNSANPEANAPTASSSVELTPEGSALVLTAPVGTGKGTWVNRWYPVTPASEGSSNVVLSVPGGVAEIGTYTAVLTWVLSDAP